MLWHKRVCVGPLPVQIVLQAPCLHFLRKSRMPIPNGRGSIGGVGAIECILEYAFGLENAFGSLR